MDNIEQWFIEECNFLGETRRKCKTQFYFSIENINIRKREKSNLWMD